MRKMSKDKLIELYKKCIVNILTNMSWLRDSNTERLIKILGLNIPKGQMYGVSCALKTTI